MPEERTQHALQLAQRALAEAQEMSDHVQQLPSAQTSPEVPQMHVLGCMVLLDVHDHEVPSRCDKWARE